MSPAGPISIEAVVDDDERPALVAAAEQLREAFRATPERDREIRLRFAPSLAAIEMHGPATLVIASLLAEVLRDETPTAIEARWRSQLSALNETASLAVFICTVFRHVASASRDRPREREAKVERIRRLNLLAAELSNDTGAGVIDIDRAFAHVGARTLQTDHRLHGGLGAEAAAHTIVRALLSTGLDDAVAPEVLQQAMQIHGPLWRIDGLTRRPAQQR